MVSLPNQDRRLWNRELIAEGQAIVRHCLARNEPGPYQIQAAINAVHSDAPVASATDWRQILQLYDHLLAMTPGPWSRSTVPWPSPRSRGRRRRLRWSIASTLVGHYLFHAIRADLLRRLGRTDDAVMAYAEAIARTDNTRERAFLRAAADELR